MNERKIKMINDWQGYGGVIYPMTCERNPKHRALVPVERNREIILQCPDCGNEQQHIPACVFDYQNHMAIKEHKIYLESLRSGIK